MDINNNDITNDSKTNYLDEHKHYIFNNQLRNLTICNRKWEGFGICMLVQIKNKLK